MRGRVVCVNTKERKERKRKERKRKEKKGRVRYEKEEAERKRENNLPNFYLPRAQFFHFHDFFL